MKSGVEVNEEYEFVVKCEKYPTCNNLSLNEDGSISAKIEKELSLDVVGETKLKVQITGENQEWVNGDDIDSIDVNYLNK